MNLPNIYIRKDSLIEKISIQKISELKAKYLETKEKNIILYSTQSIDTVSWIYASLLAGKELFILSSKIGIVERKELESSIGSFFLVDENEKNKLQTENASIKGKKYKIEKAVIQLLSSGTTGKHKRIALKMDDFIASANAHKNHFKLNKKHIWLCCLPFYHISGLSVLTRALFLEQDFAFEEDISSENISFWLKSKQIHGISMVELQLNRVLNLLKEPISKSLQYIMVGGSSVQESTIKEVLEKKLPIYLTYGSTEACSQIATTPIERQEGQSLFQLKVLDIWDIKIASDGEIFFKRKDREHYIATGDIGRKYDDEHIEVLGRKKDIIISGGVNISPKEIIKNILSIKEIEECFVWGIPDPDWGEKVAIAYATKEDISVQKIRSILEKKLHPHKRPKVFHLMRELPRNELGKIDRRAIIKSYSGACSSRKELSSPSNSPSSS